jgi:hypothetical protein
MMQTRTIHALVLAAALPLLYLADVSPDAAPSLTLVREAQAIVGAPMTPVSVAGVARRTTVRAASASAATSATSQQQAQTAQQQAATAQQQEATAKQQAATAQQQAATAARPPGAPAVGTVVNTLPRAASLRPRAASSTRTAAVFTTARPSRETTWSMWCSSRS